MRLCLNMIVKNESARIERALASVAPYIKSWVIVDTGSTDDTREKITNFFQVMGIPGEIRGVPFIDWSQARNAALGWARKLRFAYEWDNLLLMDADMQLVVKDPFWLDNLPAGHDFDMIQRAGSVHYANRRIAGAIGQYVGVTHEYYDVAATATIPDRIAYFDDYADGANRTDKYKRDIRLLEAGLKKEPNNVRYFFYLACSYRDAGKPERAAAWFGRRIAAGGWDEEVWQSKVNLAHCYKDMGKPTEFVKHLMEAYSMRPSRPESMYDLAHWYREQPNQQPAALACAEAVEHLPRSPDKLFVNDYVHQVGIQEEIAICSYYVPGKMMKGLKACSALAQHPSNYWTAINTARASIYHYLPPLGDLCPSFKSKNINFTPPKNWVALNPSVCIHHEALHVNVRCVNYRIDDEGRYMIRNTETGEINRENPINTRNFVLYLGQQVHTDATNPWEFECYHDGNVEFPLVVGFEDQRIWSRHGRLFGSASVRQLSADGVPEQVLSELLAIKSEGKPAMIHHECVRMLRKDRECEKNWAPILDGSLGQNDHLFMWRPGIVINQHGKFVLQNQPNFRTDNISGGSQIIRYHGGWLGIHHTAHSLPGKDYKRFYYHRFIQYDGDMKVKRMSLPFYLNEKAIEFVAGMCFHPVRNELVISYGFKDEEARIATVCADEVETLLCAS